jgi:DNA mismatch repair ATPase MutS
MLTRARYDQVKARHPGMVLLFRSGADGRRYTAYFADATTLAALLGGQALGAVPQWGVLADSLDTALRALLRAGHRVALCNPEE